MYGRANTSPLIVPTLRHLGRKHRICLVCGSMSAALSLELANERVIMKRKALADLRSARL
jgi:hypothetical protein